jgi:predicted ribosomally synthesized peptide with SipW-like signal peptide
MNTTRRPLVAAVVALGGVITLAGTTGVFAVFTDRATTGTNTFATKDLPRAADLEIAAGTAGAAWSINCGTYSDDLQTGLISVSDASTNQATDSTVVCLKNAGSATVDVATSVIDLSDEDTDCTGDEAVVDATCGPDQTTAAFQAGEISPLITLSLMVADCSDTNQGSRGAGGLPDVTDVSVATMAPDEVLCVRFTTRYQPTDAQAQAAQSDTATWRFAFDGTVPTT